MTSDHSDLEILVLQTGGTIDKDYPRRVGGYAFEIGESAVIGMMQRIQPDLQFTFKTVCQKDSQDMVDGDREFLWKACLEAPQTKILITHGTDTMIDTAAYLARKEPPPQKMIVLTGAFLPATFKLSDAEFNVGVSLGALQCLTETNVYVSMSGRVHRWDRVTRDSDSGKFIARA
ncbi:uncharacterized protein LOC110981935 isoform X2 [Acanthaster planci]|uniref:Uncharacterized protein LOC110981935 isoform X2 n=1 Tax=Acanthaster planci TaxID=133434 RepID=A0A8B7YQW8_ACAPL|nr:uncharacterized protein LOC110981935 isoform X2 [Acanthaster planci]